MIHPLIFNSFSALSKPLGTVPSAPTTIGITVTYIFHSSLILWFVSLFVFFDFQIVIWEFFFFFFFF